MNVKEESGKAAFKFNVQNRKITSSSPISLWQTDVVVGGGEVGVVETVADFVFLDSKITSDGDHTHGIKNACKPRQCVKKKRQNVADKSQYSQAMILPVVLYRCECWTRKKAVSQIICISNCGTGKDS